MTLSQAAILGTPRAYSRFIELQFRPGADLKAGLRSLADTLACDKAVVGRGAGLLHRLEQKVEGLTGFPALHAGEIDVPSTQADLWLWLNGEDPGQVAHAARDWRHRLDPAFQIVRSVDGLVYDGGRDLTGYEDGTENPTGDDAALAAIAQDGGAGLDGGSFVAVQQWLHDLDHFASLDADRRDNIIGRRISDNEELDDAPASAHVKRTAQESFDPKAFVLRRSMPWASADQAGLMFVAFGRSLDAFNSQMRRMAGMEDGIVDALFEFSRPITGSYFWCPPIRDGRLDLSAIL